MAVHPAHSGRPLSIRRIEDTVVSAATTTPALFFMCMPAGFTTGLLRQYSNDVHDLLSFKPPYATPAHGGIVQPFLM
jgi:hypothetical protein